MTQTVVYKIGGSLFSLPDIAERLRTLLQQRAGTRPLLVSGGGPVADLVREWDRIHELGDESAHWLALRSLMLNQSLLLELMPETRIVASRNEAEHVWSAGNLPIVCAHSFLYDEERRHNEQGPRGDLLPHHWNVTSDSVAAWIVLTWPADELVLLKSTDLPDRCDLETATTNELVDAHFANLGRSLRRISWTNLRSDAPTIQTWLP